MTNLKGTKTLENLKLSFANEAQANRRYLYFARQADLEGYPEIAGLFRDTAEGETGHAQGDLEFLKQLGDPATGMPMGDTAHNLEAAVAGETHEFTNLYPEMARVAHEEGLPELADWFERLTRAEKNHAARFAEGLRSIRG
jgi:rubrerythrin